MTLTSAACPVTGVMEDQIRAGLAPLSGVEEVRIDWRWTPAWRPADITDSGREHCAPSASPSSHRSPVLRCWSPSRAPGEEGMLRDSAMFSVLAAEWPAVKSALAIRVAHASAGSRQPR